MHPVFAFHQGTLVSRLFPEPLKIQVEKKDENSIKCSLQSIVCIPTLLKEKNIAYFYTKVKSVVDFIEIFFNGL